MAIGRAVAKLYISGKGDAVADALSRFSIHVRGLDPYPDRELRDKRRIQVQGRCGALDIDMMVSDDVHNARDPCFRPPSNPAFEGPLPRGRSWRFPRIEMVDLGLARIASSMSEDWFGAHLRLIPLFPWKNWSCKLAPCERVLSWPAGTSLFVGRIPGKPLEVPNVENARRAVFRLMGSA